MTKEYIDKGIMQYYKQFMSLGVAILTSWVILIFNQDLLLIPIAISGIMVYLFIRMMPEYYYWNKINRCFAKEELEKFIDEEYKTLQNVKEIRANNSLKQTVTGSSFDRKYRTQRDIYMSRKRMNKGKILFELKKCLEMDKSQDIE